MEENHNHPALLISYWELRVHTTEQSPKTLRIQIAMLKSYIVYQTPEMCPLKEVRVVRRNFKYIYYLCMLHHGLNLKRKFTRKFRTDQYETVKSYYEPFHAKIIQPCQRFVFYAANKGIFISAIFSKMF